MVRRWFFRAVIAVAVFSGSAAQARWREASSAHFVIYSEQSSEQLKRYAETLEQYDALLQLLGTRTARVPTKAARVTVFLVSDLAALRRVFGARNAQVAGFYLPRAETPVAFAPVADGGGGPSAANVLTSQNVLLHEYAHHYMFLNSPSNLPAWYREGFAEFVAATVFADDGGVTIGGAAMHRAYGLRGGAITIADVAMGKVYNKPADGDEFYARSWQLFHFLTFQTDRKGQLDTYLRLLLAGEPAAKAAPTAFGDLAKLERDARSYMTGRSIPATRLASGALRAPPVTIDKLSEGENAAIPVRMVSLRGVDRAAADLLVPQGRGIATRFPTDLAVQDMLAEVEIDAHNYPEAIAAADRVLSKDSMNVHALVIRGRALMAQAVASKATDEVTWKEVRRWFSAGNRADRADPAPLIYYYASFAAAGQPVSSNAAVAIAEAARLAPQDGTVHATLIRYLLSTGNLQQARQQLMLAASDTHGRAAGRLAPVWAAVEANDAPAALTAFDQAMVPPATKS